MNKKKRDPIDDGTKKIQPYWPNQNLDPYG